MFGQGFNLGFFADPPCFTDTTDIFKDNSGIALYTLDYDASSGKDITTNTLQILKDTSCIATYKLNGNSADLSGNYNGTDTSITYTNGYFGKCASFNGSSSNISVNGSILNSRTAISYSAWVYYKGTGSGQSYGHIISGGATNSTASGKAFGMAVQNSNDLLYIWASNGETSFTSTALPENVWTHLAVTNSGGTAKMYMNGSLIHTANLTSLAFNSSSNNLRIGEYFYNGSHHFYGEIDQVRIFNKVLSASEITTLYNEMGERNGVPSNVDFGIEGKTLYGAKFNGSNSYVDLPLTSIFGGKNTFTVSLWFKTTTTTRSRIFTDYAQTSRNCDIIFDSDGTIEVTTDYNQSSNLIYNSTTKYNDDNWHHISVSLNQATSQRTIYIDGSLVNTGTLSSNNWSGSGQKVSLGVFYSSSSGYSQYFDGEIDQLRIFNKALSSSEVSKLYGNGAGEIACEYTPTTTDVNYPVTNLAYYKLDNNSKDSGKSRGKFNQGVTFIGNSAGIVNTTLQLSSTAHSVSLWMKPQDLTATKWQIMFFSAFNGYPSFTLGKRPDRTTSFHYRNESSQEVYFTLSNANTWYHVVVTRNNSGSTIYVNGSSVATDSNSMGTYGSSSYEKASIGSNPLYPAEYFDGTLDQIRVYNVALTATDVANLYNNETTTTAGTLSFPTGKTAIATYKLDGDGVDISGNYSGDEGDNIVYGYDGSDTNVEYTFGKYGQAAVFNGSNSKITFTAPDFNITTYSLSFWINAANYNQSGTSIINMGLDNTGGAWSGIAFGVDSNKIFYYGGDVTGVGGTGFFTQTGTRVITNGAWVHVAIIVNGTAITGYVNGTQDYGLSRTLGANITYRAGSINTIGVRQGAFGSYGWWNGSVDQFKIFSSALSSDQITQLYNEKPETDTSNFKTVLWDGNGSTQYISNVGFEPGFAWIKKRTNDTKAHRLFDIVRGANNVIYSNLNNVEANPTNELTSFEANGFFLGNASAVNDSDSNDSYVAWNWKGSGFQPSQTFSDIKTQGLIAHWNATQSASLYAGSTWYDLTSNNRNLTHYTTSVSNMSIGRNNGGTVDMNSTDQFYTSQFINDQTFTIGGWFRKDANNGNNATLWSQGYSPSIRLQIYGGSTGDRIYHYLNNGSSGPSYDTGIDVPKSAWFHIMVTYDLSNGTVKLYLNGTLSHTASTITGTFYSGSNSDQYFRVTRNSTNANGYLTGAISQIRVYSDVLTAAEVLNDYNATKGLFQSNNEGTISATVDANQDAGFSIVKYTGNSLANMTVGHGLSQSPQIVISKRLDSSQDWGVYTNVSTGNNTTYWLSLNDADAYGSGNFMNLSSTLLSAVATGAFWIQGTQIAYCWHSVAGYSKISSYSGSGVSGKKITLDFSPSFVLIKRTDATAGWVIVDDKRGTKELYPHLSNTEDTTTTSIVLGTNKFTLNSTGSWYNASGGTYLYMAFK